MVEQPTLAEYLGLEPAPRSIKPRKAGLTMVMDQGWPTVFVAGMLEAFGNYIDIAKLWDPHLQQHVGEVTRKIDEYRKHEVLVQPGGIWLEIARKQGKELQLIKTLSDMGFNAIEISATTHTHRNLVEDVELVNDARDLGFVVLGEVGRKFADGDETRISEKTLDVDRTVQEFTQLLEAGAWKVYWEGHLLRKVLGDRPAVIKSQAPFATSQIKGVAEEIGAEHIIFEASGLRPRANRQWLQFWLIRLFGPEVNIGNARIEEIGNLEALRYGTHPIFGFGSSGNYPWLHG